MKESPYRLSFTSATLRVEETIAMARYINDQSQREAVNHIPDDLFGNLKQSTHARLVRELKARLSNFSEEAMSLLVHGEFPDQKNMCYLGILKTYPFIRHFVEKVLISNNEIFRTQVEEWQYRDFFNAEEMNHSELRKMSEESLKKIKRNMFTILREAEIISGKREIRITPIFPGSSELAVLSQEEQNWIPYFTLRYN